MTSKIIMEKGEQLLEVTKVQEPIIERKNKIQVLIEIQQVEEMLAQQLFSVQETEARLATLNENLALFD